MKITVAGIGPGNEHYVLPIVKETLVEAEVVIGYKYYFQFVEHYIPERTECITMDMGTEEDRANMAISKALEGYNVVVIGSGDASIYSMASIVYEMVARQQLDKIELQTLPGISAFLAAGSKLGAPLGHDLCCISLSDLMTPWRVIEKRIRAAAMGDFVTCLYNPRSKKRYWQLGRLKTIFLQERSPETPVGICRQITRSGEHIQLTTLGKLASEHVDMFTLVVIGNSQSYRYKDHIITPRGYLDRKANTGEEIQQESFRIVAGHLKEVAMDLADKWAATRIIHTTGIPENHQCYRASPGAIQKWNHYLKNGGDIVTDVTMVQSGITKKYLRKYGGQVHCFLNDEDTIEQARADKITRSQAGIRKAIKLFPNALYAIGNAPTALTELTDELLYNKQFNPAGIIGVPVGFVNVIEAKAQLTQSSADHVVFDGNRGGSNVAAAIVNAAYTLEEARLYFQDQDENKESFE